MIRKSCRTYSSKKIKYEDINEIIISATNYAPSSCNHQMWHFVAVDDENIKLKIQKISGSNQHFIEAPWIIVVLTHLGWNHNKFAVIQSAAAANQMILKYAENKGFSACWNAGLGNTNKIKRLLNIKRQFEPIAVISIGYPGKNENFELKPPRRKGEVIISRNYFKRKNDSIYPLKGSRKVFYHKALNHKNKYSVHNPREWTYAQIGNFRSFSVFAKSPFENTYISRRFSKEIEKEIIPNQMIKNKINNYNTSILEILPYGGTHTNFIAKKFKGNITIAEYSKNNFDFINKRLSKFNDLKLKLIHIGNDGVINNNKKQFDLIYNNQTLEQQPNPKKYLKEVYKLSKPNSKIVFSVRNILSWYGVFYTFSESKGQVSNFGPHRPIASFKAIFLISKLFKIKNVYGISPRPSSGGMLVKNFLLKYFCRLFLVVCEKK